MRILDELKRERKVHSFFKYYFGGICFVGKYRKD
jgi:hypothetical protein